MIVEYSKKKLEKKKKYNNAQLQKGHDLVKEQQTSQKNWTKVRFNK